MLSFADLKYLEIAYRNSMSSTCLAQDVGAVLVRHGQILSLGWNRSPASLISCKMRGHCRNPGDHCQNSGQPSRAVHAEAVAILGAMATGGKTAGTTIYVTHPPCLNCLKLIVEAGVCRLVYRGDRIEDPLRLELMRALAVDHAPQQKSPYEGAMVG